MYKLLKYSKCYLLATELVDEKLESMKSGDDQSSLFLSRLLRKKDVAMNEIYSNMLDLLIAGTDTVRFITSLFDDSTYS